MIDGSVAGGGSPPFVNRFQGYRGAGALVLLVSVTSLSAQELAANLGLVPVTPCRVMDTRVEGGKSGAFGPPAFTIGVSRTLPCPLADADCQPMLRPMQ